MWQRFFRGFINLNWLCTALYCVFSACYLCIYQIDFLTYLFIRITGYVYSNGGWIMAGCVGALMITSYFAVKRWRYFPQNKSAILFIAPTCIALLFTNELIFSISGWVYLSLSIFVFISTIYAIGRINVAHEDNQERAAIWLAYKKNLLLLLIQFCILGFGGISDALTHYRLSAERLLLSNRYADVLKIGVASARTDSALTMLRIHAMAQTNQLADSLFYFPVTGGSASLLPASHQQWCFFYPTRKIYEALQLPPANHTSPMELLKQALQNNPSRRLAEYYLIGCLLDKKIDLFAQNFYAYSRFFPVNHIPKHFREALTLYTHLRSNPMRVYSETVMETDFQDFQQLEYKFRNNRICQYMRKESHGNTYWYYYFYQ